MTQVNRSKGVTLLGWLFIVKSLMAIVGLFTLKNRLAAYEAAHFNLPDTYYYVVQSFTSLNMVLSLVAGIGLLRTLSWGRILAVSLTVLSFLYEVGFHFVYIHRYTVPYFISSGKPVFVLYISLFLGLLWTAFICYYFNRPGVKGQFQ